MSAPPSIASWLSPSQIWEHRRIIFLATTVNFGALLFGYDSGIAGAAVVLPSFQNTFGISGSAAEQASISSNIVSILYGGAFFGAILAAVASFYLGRRKSLLIGCAFFLVGGVIQTTSSSVAQLYVGRLLAGFGVGAVSQVCPIFVSECASKEHRSRAVAAFQLCLVTGGMLAYWVGYSVSVRVSPDSAAQWKIPIGFQLAPGGLFTLGLFFVPESPRFLAYQQVRRDRSSRAPYSPKAELPDGLSSAEITPEKEGKSEDIELAAPTLRGILPDVAIEPAKVPLFGSLAWQMCPLRSRQPNEPREFPPIYTLAYLRKQPLSSPTLKAEMAEIFAQLDETEDERSRGKGSWKELLKKPSNRKRLMIAAFVGSWQIWVAQTAILYYAPTIFMSIGFSSSSTSLLASGVFTALKVLTTIAALALTVNRFGRVIGMSVGGLLQGILFFLIGIILATHPVDETRSSPSGASVAMMALIYVYVFVYSFTIGPLPWMYASEIFPSHLRDAGQLVFVLLTWSNNFAVAKLTPIGFAEIGWRLWLIYGSFNVGGAVICWFLCPETKGRSMEEIDIIFGVVTEEERATHVEKVLQQTPQL